jgi:DhnA family fructose-bisphosphate aldolase class Ia/sugar phosphate isomerase/epimerase
MIVQHSKIKNRRSMSLADNPRSLVFYMAYPGPGNLDGASRSLIDPKYLLASLDAVLDDEAFDVLELTSLKSKRLQAEVAKKLKSNGKRIAFHCEPVQWVNEENLIDPADLSSASEVHRRRAVDRIRRLMDEAAGYGADQVFVASGRNPASGKPYDQENDRLQAQAMQALTVSLRQLAKEAKDRDMALAVSVCDSGSTEVGIYRHALIGRAARAAALMDPLRGEGYDNLGLSIDLGRLRLNGEGPEVVPEIAPYLQWVHVSNVVLGQGDTHPRFGAADSQVGTPQLSAFMRALSEVDYTGPIGVAVQSAGSDVPDKVVRVALSLLNEAADTTDVAYSLPLGFSYRGRDFLTEEAFAEITELRVKHPELAREELKKRKRRDVLAPDGKLVILAADHPARGVTRVGSQPVGMGHRLDYLGRIVRVLAASKIDGLMGTSDLVDEVVLANYLVKQRGGRDFLADKVLLGSMNRTGLQGAEHEMMDRTSSYMTGKRLKEMNLDGAKLLWRWVPAGERNDRYALETLERVAKAVEELTDVGLPAFIEPLPVARTETGYRTDLTTDNIIKAIGIASALGYYTGHVWLKIPYVADFARVAKASTFPILLLGGEATGRPSATIEDFVRGMGAGPNIRGALVGRNVLFCGEDDPAAVAEAINLVVHKGLSAIEAMAQARKVRGTMMDLFG